MDSIRKVRDSNPGYSFEYARLPSVDLKPLGQLSKVIRNKKVCQTIDRLHFETDTIRTCDLVLRRDALYPKLSYNLKTTTKSLAFDGSDRS